jgi:hypothetical protein
LADDVPVEASKDDSIYVVVAVLLGILAGGAVGMLSIVAR